MSNDLHASTPQMSAQEQSAPAATSSLAPRLTMRRLVHALRQPAGDERTAGVPKVRYRLPLQWLMAMGRDMLAGQSRSFREDCALAVRSLPLPPLVDGLEHIPPAGSFLLVANHYQRRDLWIGWSGGLLCDALWRARPDLAFHWVTEDRAIVDGRSVPLTGWLFARVAQVWDFVLVTPPEARDVDSQHSRRHALRHSLRKLKRPDGRSVCLGIMPEGISGNTRGLQRAIPGSGRSLLALAATGIPLLPAAVWEEQTGALHARFGQAWRPQPPTTIAHEDVDHWMGDDMLRRIAALMPLRYRGAYADEDEAATGTA